VVPLDVKAGDRILFTKYSGSEIKLDGQEYLILREDEVLRRRRDLWPFAKPEGEESCDLAGVAGGSPTPTGGHMSVKAARQLFN